MGIENDVKREQMADAHTTSRGNLGIQNDRGEIAPRLTRPQFMVGLSVHVDLAVEGKPFKSRVVVVGWVEEQFLLVTAPTLVLPTLQPIFDGPITFRYLLDGVIYGFRAAVSRRIVKPTQLWLVNYPTQVEYRSLRRQTRTTVLIPMTVKLHGRFHEGLILDISAGGALLSFPSVLENTRVHDRLTLDFHLPGGVEVKALGARIRSVRAETASMQLGVQFEPGEPAEEVARFLAGLPTLKADFDPLLSGLP